MAVWFLMAGTMDEPQPQSGNTPPVEGTTAPRMQEAPPVRFGSERSNPDDSALDVRGHQVLETDV